MWWWWIIDLTTSELSSPRRILSCSKILFLTFSHSSIDRRNRRCGHCNEQKSWCCRACLLLSPAPFYTCSLLCPFLRVSSTRKGEGGCESVRVSPGRPRSRFHVPEEDNRQLALTLRYSFKWFNQKKNHKQKYNNLCRTRIIFRRINSRAIDINEKVWVSVGQDPDFMSFSEACAPVRCADRCGLHLSYAKCLRWWYLSTFSDFYRVNMYGDDFRLGKQAFISISSEIKDMQCWYVSNEWRVEVFDMIRNNPQWRWIKREATRYGEQGSSENGWSSLSLALRGVSVHSLRKDCDEQVLC